ncbi:MAG: hypothetical protein HWE21_08015 [Cytophagia bacterium]|nr:hypothetical protein [Cytophagia bacterium]
MIRKPNFKLNWKYALGELALIFVGITLAVAFQNWNEDRRLASNKLTYYKNLVIDIEKDNAQLETLLLSIDEHNRFYRRVDSLVATDNSSGEKFEQMLSYFVNDFFLFEFFPNTDTFDDLIASGNIKILDPEIRFELTTLSNLHTKYRRYESGNNQGYLDLSARLYEMTQVFDRNQAWSEFLPKPDEKAKTIFFNLIRFTEDSDRRTEVRYNELIQLNKTLIRKIEDELR